MPPPSRIAMVNIWCLDVMSILIGPIGPLGLHHYDRHVPFQPIVRKVCTISYILEGFHVSYQANFASHRIRDRCYVSFPSPQSGIGKQQNVPELF